MEINVKDKVLVELEVKQIIEDSLGVSYAVCVPGGWSTICVPESLIEDVIESL
jgi:hypothetical protein